MGDYFSQKNWKVTRIFTVSKLQKFYFPSFPGEHFQQCVMQKGGYYFLNHQLL